MKNSLLKNGFYNTVAGAVRIGLAVLTIPILIRLIGVEEYGLWTLASSVVALVALAEAGLSTATTVFVSQDLAKEDVDGLSQTLTVTFTGMLILATLAAIILYIVANSLVDFFPKLQLEQRLAVVKALQLAALVVWARLLQQVVFGVEQAYQKYAVMNLLVMLQSLLSNLGSLIVAWLGGRTVELMQCQVVINFLVLAAHISVIWLLVRDVKLRLRWSRSKGFAIARYSIITWLATLGGALFTQADRLIVGGLLGTNVLGVYAAITNITSQINIFSALPVQPLLPAISSQIAVKQDIDQVVLQGQVKQALQINSLVALGMGAILCTFAPAILRLMLGGEISDQTVLAFYIAIVIYALYSVNAVGFYILFGVNAVNICMAVQLFSGINSLFLIAVGANSFGLIGAILGNAGYLGIWLLTYFGMKKLHIYTPLWLGWIKFPLVWFFVIFLTSITNINQALLKVFILTIQILILFVWFILAQPNYFKLLIQNND
ncbi:polysaccharide biosynthesis protein [Calothrix sp. NIES-4071]|nr:polysaccharide biosynthesis protein [Calothrix sp. NIES-4071]BAZ57043.1 polysaccharide biosynthesis protein [Calothrix sp. NIES-4105]